MAWTACRKPLWLLLYWLFLYFAYKNRSRNLKGTTTQSFITHRQVQMSSTSGNLHTTSHLHELVIFQMPCSLHAYKALIVPYKKHCAHAHWDLVCRPPLHNFYLLHPRPWLLLSPFGNCHVFIEIAFKFIHVENFHISQVIQGFYIICAPNVSHWIIYCSWKNLQLYCESISYVNECNSVASPCYICLHPNQRWVLSHNDTRRGSLQRAPLTIFITKTLIPTMLKSKDGPSCFSFSCSSSMMQTKLSAIATTLVSPRISW
jgi:hypothetical protein